MSQDIDTRFALKKGIRVIFINYRKSWWNALCQHIVLESCLLRLGYPLIKICTYKLSKRYLCSFLNKRSLSLSLSLSLSPLSLSLSLDKHRKVFVCMCVCLCVCVCKKGESLLWLNFSLNFLFIFHIFYYLSSTFSFFYHSITTFMLPFVTPYI